MGFTIGEFSKMLGVSTSTLRYYEKEGLIKPQRDNNNLRVYTEDNLNWGKFLLHLKGTGMTIEELKQYTRWRDEGDSTISNRLSFLKEKSISLQQEIASLQANLDIVFNKIGIYEEKLISKETAGKVEIN